MRPSPIGATTDEAVIERVAKALYAVEWETISGNDRDGHWAYEESDVHEYWRKSARAAIGAAELDRLRAELDRSLAEASGFEKQLNALADSGDYLEYSLRAELDRLRAENARLRAALKLCAAQCSIPDPLEAFRAVICTAERAIETAAAPESIP